MATGFEITYFGEPTEADWARVAELAAQGYTSGQLVNDDEPDPAEAHYHRSDGKPGKRRLAPCYCDTPTTASRPGS